MVRTSIVATILSVTLAFACNTASDEQRKINTARAEADNTIDAAIKEAEQKMRDAQQEADRKVAEAQAGFLKMREDYRHTTTINLADLDHKVDDLEGKARQSAGKARTDLDASLKQIHASRNAFQSDAKWLETVSASAWDDAKARLDKEWTELKTLVDKA
jgi:vacuolar-type H+-ATPase subunit H